MARFAASACPVSPRLPHPFFELALVRVGVATGATQARPVVDHSRLRLELRRFLVAVGAGHRDVPSGKDEMRLLVPRQRECRRLVGFQIVTAVAGVEIRRCRKLRRMFVSVAIGATLELYLEQRLLALGKVTQLALHPRVPTLQRICAGCVLLNGESRGLPSDHRVARGAFAAAGALGKLSAVRIGLVTIHAPLESEGFLEISAGMTLCAIDRRVFSCERIFRFGMVEALVYRRK